MEPEICKKMLKTWSENLRPKICCHHTWLLHGKSCPPQGRFPTSFLTVSKTNQCSKKERKGGKGKAKNNSENRKAQRRKSLSINFDFCAWPNRNVANQDARARKIICHDASAFLTRLKLIWPRFKKLRCSMC